MSPRSRLAVAFASTLIVGYVALGSVLGRVMGDTTYGQLALFNEVLRLVMDAYVEPVNVDRAMQGARVGLTDALDGDSAYLDADEFKAYSQPVRENEAEIGIIVSRRLAFLMVVTVRAGSPAARAGLRPGDLLKTIDGRHTRPVSAVIAHRLLRGAPGSAVKLSVLRAGADPLDFSVVRERLTPLAPESRMLAGGAGYLKITEFNARVADDVKGEVESLKKAGARQMVLDLRGAGHGAHAEGVKVAELFLKGGTIAKLAGPKAAEQVLVAEPSRGIWDRPLAVLTDHGTSGPGEIVAAALLDAGRAVVGEQTLGRAGVQRSVPLAEGGLVLTVSKYVSPKGTPIHGKGVTPSVPVDAPDTEDEETAAAGADRILEKALEVLRTPEKKAA